MSIPAVLHVLKHSKSKQSRFNLLIWLANHANDAGEAWPSVRTLAEESGYKRKWVEQILQELVDTRELMRVKVWRSYRYRLYLYDAKSATCSCVITDHENTDTAPHGHLLPSHGQWSDANPTPLQANPAEPIQEPRETTRKTCTGEVTSPIADGCQSGDCQRRRCPESNYCRVHTDCVVCAAEITLAAESLLARMPAATAADLVAAAQEIIGRIRGARVDAVLRELPLEAWVMSRISPTLDSLVRRLKQAI